MIHQKLRQITAGRATPLALHCETLVQTEGDKADVVESVTIQTTLLRTLDPLLTQTTGEEDRGSRKFLRTPGNT